MLFRIFLLGTKKARIAFTTRADILFWSITARQDPDPDHCRAEDRPD